MNVKIKEDKEAAYQWEQDIKIRIELRYPKVAIDALRRESRPLKRQQILCDARHGRYDDI